MTLTEVPARATVRPPLGGLPIDNSGRDGFEMPVYARRAAQFYWGMQCGRCTSHYTVIEDYPRSEGGREYWCATCGTELDSKGQVLFPGGRDARTC